MLQQHQKCRQENLFSHFPHLPQRTLDVASVAAATEVKLRPMCLRFVSHLCWGQAAVSGGSGYLTTLKFQLNSFELRPESVNRNELWTAIVTAVASVASRCWLSAHLSCSLSVATPLGLHMTCPRSSSSGSSSSVQSVDYSTWRPRGRCKFLKRKMSSSIKYSWSDTDAVTQLNSTEFNWTELVVHRTELNSIQFHRDPLSLSLSLAFSWQCFVAKFQLQLQLLSTSSRLFKLQYSKLSRPRYHTHLQHRLDSHSLLSLKSEWWRGEGEEYIISQLGSFILCAVSKSCVRAPTFPKL